MSCNYIIQTKVSFGETVESLFTNNNVMYFIHTDGLWGNCIVTTYAGDTPPGSSCYFPFMYGGHTYYDCTSLRNTQAWCRCVFTNNIVMYFIHTDGLWGNCLITTFEGTAPPGSSCYFPFTYDDQVYNDCTSVKSAEAWCYTRDDSGKLSSLWGLCNEATCNDSRECFCTTAAELNSHIICWHNHIMFALLHSFWFTP